MWNDDQSKDALININIYSFLTLQCVLWIILLFKAPSIDLSSAEDIFLHK